jgi:hypothetical protein
MTGTDQEQIVKAIWQRRRELEALKETPEGLREIATLFRTTVLLPGEFMPAGLSVEAMIDDIAEIEFKRLKS